MMGLFSVTFKFNYNKNFNNSRPFITINNYVPISVLSFILLCFDQAYLTRRSWNTLPVTFTKFYICPCTAQIYSGVFTVIQLNISIVLLRKTYYAFYHLKSIWKKYFIVIEIDRERASGRSDGMREMASPPELGRFWASRRYTSTPSERPLHYPTDPTTDYLSVVKLCL